LQTDTVITLKMFVTTTSPAVAERPRDAPYRWKFLPSLLSHSKSLEVTRNYTVD